jgi:hypothetical protein
MAISSGAAGLKGSQDDIVAYRIKLPDSVKTALYRRTPLVPEQTAPPVPAATPTKP